MRLLFRVFPLEGVEWGGVDRGSGGTVPGCGRGRGRGRGLRLRLRLPWSEAILPPCRIQRRRPAGFSRMVVLLWCLLCSVSLVVFC